MPLERINGTELYYEVHGCGGPLVLIQGLAGSSQAWVLQVRAFKKRFQVITFDNRGTGRTGKSPTNPTIEIMAADVVALLDHLGIAKADILGLSMGGMIAQEIAISYPERVNKLVLCSTFAVRDLPGQDGPGQKPAIRDADFTAFMDSAISRSYNTAIYRLLFRALFHLNRKGVDPAGVFQQAGALSEHSTLERLHLVKAPTLIMTGTGDRLVPPEHSDILASRIPGAVLIKVPGGSHAFFFEKPGIFNREVLAFLTGPNA